MHICNNRWDGCTECQKPAGFISPHFPNSSCFWPRGGGHYYWHHFRNVELKLRVGKSVLQVAQLAVVDSATAPCLQSPHVMFASALCLVLTL